MMITTQAIYFSHRLRPPEVRLTLNGWNILFVIFDKGTKWRLHVEMVEAKAFKTYI
jgi:hypothetical protein